MKQEKIARINELAKKKKEIGLTPAEIEERAKLHQEYLSAVRRNAKASLDQLKSLSKNQ